MRFRLWVALLAGLVLCCESTLAQVIVTPQASDAAFKGIHRHKGVNGGVEKVTITDGKAYLRVTEQEYRERGYAPEFEHLPTIFVQRLPVRVRIPPKDLD